VGVAGLNPAWITKGLAKRANPYFFYKTYLDSERV
jgi:hypothetical protein